MGTVSQLVLPLALILARMSGFVAVLPVFASRSIPIRVRAGVALVLSVFLALVLPRPALGPMPWVTAALVVVGEIGIGAGLGLAAALVFMAVNQAGAVMRQQMGLSVAQEIDPTTGERSQPVALLMEMAFTILFLMAGGLELMVRLAVRSYDVMPIATWPDPAELAAGVVEAGALMLLFALKLAAPMVAAFLVLAVVLAILARALPEMNILLASLPLRVGLGLFMAAAIMPSLGAFTETLADWMSTYLVT